MNKRVITGHSAIDNEDYIVVKKNSEKWAGSLLGFVTGSLISLLLIDVAQPVLLLIIVIVGTFFGLIIAPGGRTESIPRHRIEKILEKRNFVKVYYTTGNYLPQHSKKML